MFSGEVSERQKMELEQKSAKIEQQQLELTELRQQLAKLSEIVDKQTAEVKQLNAEAKLVIIIMIIIINCGICWQPSNRVAAADSANSWRYMYITEIVEVKFRQTREDEFQLFFSLALMFESKFHPASTNSKKTDSAINWLSKIVDEETAK